MRRFLTPSRASKTPSPNPNPLSLRRAPNARRRTTKRAAVRTTSGAGAAAAAQGAQTGVRLAVAVGAMVLPLMIFHQVQLMTCGALAARYGRRSAELVAAA